MVCPPSGLAGWPGGKGRTKRCSAGSTGSLLQETIKGHHRHQTGQLAAPSLDRGGGFVVEGSGGAVDPTWIPPGAGATGSRATGRVFRSASFSRSKPRGSSSRPGGYRRPPAAWSAVTPPERAPDADADPVSSSSSASPCGEGADGLWRKEERRRERRVSPDASVRGAGGGSPTNSLDVAKRSEHPS